MEAVNFSVCFRFLIAVKMTKMLSQFFVGRDNYKIILTQPVKYKLKFAWFEMLFFCFCTFLCNQIWRNFATLVKSYMTLVTFSVFI